jgi:hypothetical protein
MPLRNLNGLSLYCKKNKDKPWYEWLKFDKILRKPGKQGTVGIMKGKNGETYVFKLSKYINHLITHESIILEGLYSISCYCPNFVQWMETITCKIDPFNRDSDDPFKIESKYPIYEEIVLTEFLNKTHKFFSYIKTGEIEEDVLYSIVKQVLLAIVIAQKKKRFTHYDLHSNNVMIKKCDPNLVMLYVIDEENQYCVPTLGYYPVIIDFGFSYIKDLEDGPLWPSMGHTDVGFCSDRYDWVSDPKLFLVTVSDEIKEERDSRSSHKFRRIVRNIFQPLDIDWESGWDNDNTSASGYVLNLLEPYNNISEVFKKYDYYCIDILQTLIILPLEENPYEDIGKNYSAFIKEWVKIEDMISSVFYNIYVLKGIVKAAGTVRAAYIDLETRNDALLTFQKSLYAKLAEISQFCVPRGLNIEVLLCSMILLAANIEGMLYEFMEVRMKEKQNEYEKLPINSTEQVYAVVETNISTPYTYSKKTIVCVIDSVNENNKEVKLSENQAAIVNDTYFLARGTTLYDITKEH